MQGVNKYCYNTGVGRAQTQIDLNCCIVKLGIVGYLRINEKYLMSIVENHKYFIKPNETKKFSKEQLVDQI